MTSKNPTLSSIDDILERLLSLDFYRDLVQDSNDNLKQIQKRIKWDSPLVPLPYKISSVEEYHASFFSLFMIECLEIISQSKYNDLSIPSPLEPISCNISGVFGYVTFSFSHPLPDFSPGDLVCLFLRKHNFVSNKRDISTVLGYGIDKYSGSNGMSLSHPVYEDSINHAIGYLVSILKNRIVLKILLLPPSFATPETFDDRDLDRLMSIQNQLRYIYSPRQSHAVKGDSECWYVSKLISLTTILREFKGLCMLSNMPLKDSLLTVMSERKNTLDPDTTNELIVDFEVPPRLKRTIEENYNSGQLSAVSNSLMTEGISLIQGPPGTGKTTTIMGIVIHLGSENHSNRRILICAPSNAAIDEIVKRLVSPDGGIFDPQGNRYNPTVTRVGPNFHEDLKEYSLETKLKKWLSKNNLSHLKGDRGNTAKRPTIIMDILLNSEIVCSTLSGCGSRELYGLINCFDTLIIDEATQAVELSTLIPFNLGCKRAILVGDPCQLSATVCSKVAIQLNYDQSLFKRLQLCGYPVNFLKLQYRMDPLITRFPSMYFYQNQLINAKKSLSKPEEDWRQFPLFRPTVFFAIDSHESRNDTSYVNEMEVDLVCQLLEMLIEIMSTIPGITAEEIARKIAVISPYAAQAEILKSTISQRIKINPQTNVPDYSKITPSKTNQIYVSTVDGFQGMEKDIIIFSAVRTNYVDLTANVIDASFIADRRRINVAITRACSNLLIVGNPRYLLDHKHWSALYNHYAKTGSIFICKTVNNKLDPNYLKNWSKEYLKKDPDRVNEFLRNKYLVKFVTDLMS
ncbi:tRNA-splicing endonuclease [Theileria orientalis strain Shintoku]|uniref:tRNA-splicing endonuclease n=1 Tax=Theileria orientalis strain Shintoku TaxID=869250 RepID=J4C931_THEOR|nr:tRNA-splicing endonuclease [Theileria orientalis strain Shintoku]BAM41828.1 tRNA-splicing endonuclease [Theileria orientalis strain Shintoku]|eukprot:XP_009692129.1 tRNA-splicing endonuclease [Theileria orientalis strain Shintoku]